MPLHLLGKKSWNVYNTTNIDRVRRDEQEAREREEAEEQRQQQEDAARRVDLLRQRQDELVAEPKEGHSKQDRTQLTSRKRRRLDGEDDTDRDLRRARENMQQGEAATIRIRSERPQSSLFGNDGHIELFSASSSQVAAGKIQKTQSASHVAGDTFGEQVHKLPPWYVDDGRETEDHDAESTLDTLANVNVWGREDGKRKDREQTRMSSADPLSFMKSAQNQLKQSRAAKDRWAEERQAELASLKAAQSDDHAHRRHRRKRDKDVHRHSRHSRDRVQSERG